MRQGPGGPPPGLGSLVAPVGVLGPPSYVTTDGVVLSVQVGLVCVWLSLARALGSTKLPCPPQVAKITGPNADGVLREALSVLPHK